MRQSVVTGNILVQTFIVDMGGGWTNRTVSLPKLLSGIFLRPCRTPRHLRSNVHKGPRHERRSRRVEGYHIPCCVKGFLIDDQDTPHVPDTS